MLKQWIIQPPWDRCREASTRWNVHPIVAQLLFNRGIDIDGDPKAFLSPRMDELYRPECIPGTTKAADLLAEAVEKRRRIVIYGDYDVDGITGTAILWKVLRQAGADVRYYVPHRLDEGYGLNLEALQKLSADGAQVLVSVDCGVTAVDEVAAARASGLQVIITDHHEPGELLPDAS